MTLCEIALKNEQNLMIGSHTFIERTPLIAIGRSCMMITWQSWAFKQLMFNFKSFMFAILLIFDEYHVGTFSSWKNHKSLSFSFVCNNHDVTGSFFLPSSSVKGCSSALTPISCKSIWHWSESFPLPFDCINIPSKLFGYVHPIKCVPNMQRPPIRQVPKHIFFPRRFRWSKYASCALS